MHKMQTFCHLTQDGLKYKEKLFKKEARLNLCGEISMKKPIYILLLICVLMLLPSCGRSGERQENRPGFSGNGSEAGDENSMDKPQFAAEEPEEIGVSEITAETFAAPEYNIPDGTVRAFGEEISAAGVRKGDLVENAMTYSITDAEIFDSSDAAGIDPSAMEAYIDYRFTDENGNLRAGVQFLLVDLTIRNNEMPQELNISSLELTYCEPSQTDLSVRSFYPLAYPAYFSNAGPRQGEYSSEYYHYTLPAGESLSVKVGWYVDLTKYDKSALFLIFNSRIETLRQYLPLFPA